MQVPPARASTLHSSAMIGEPGTQPGDSAPYFRGGSQVVTAELDSMPGPKSSFTATGFPSRISNSAGTNQDEMPGPVAMARQTSSGVPGTSTSTWTKWRPDASFFTLMMAPWILRRLGNRIFAADSVTHFALHFAARDAPRPPGDAPGRQPRMHRGTSPPVS